jgi:uncharacterized repeat protein (TIGR03803 family)
MSSIRLRISLAVVTLAVIFVFAALPVAHAQTFSVVYTFGTGTDGTLPTGLLLGSDGNLYGTTLRGGTHNVGTVFKVDTTGTETILYNFTGGADGGQPNADMIRDTNGNFYGTTSLGGGTGCNDGCGTVFNLTPTGHIHTLHSFSGGAENHGVFNGLTSFNGELYGTSDLVNGEIYKISRGGAYQLLYSFTDGADGMEPGPIVADSTGNLYGTTYTTPTSAGTVYKFDTAGNLNILYTFPNTQTTGGLPQARLLLDVNGNIHGTTISGGKNNCNLDGGCGVVFRLSNTGTETVAHRFGSIADDGDRPGNLVDINGVLYGITSLGGDLDDCKNQGCGTIFSIAGDGAYTVLYRFSGGSDGSQPGNLIKDAAGNLYGIAARGGIGNGVVFKIAP